jgi:hypothetical protein
MKRPKIKPPKPAPPPVEGQIEMFDRLTMLIITTDCDPDYPKAKEIFAELLAEMQ